MPTRRRRISTGKGKTHAAERSLMRKLVASGQLRLVHGYELKKRRRKKKVSSATKPIAGLAGLFSKGHKRKKSTTKKAAPKRATKTAAGRKAAVKRTGVTAKLGSIRMVSGVRKIKTKGGIWRVLDGTGAVPGLKGGKAGDVKTVMGRKVAKAATGKWYLLMEGYMNYTGASGDAFKKPRRPAARKTATKKAAPSKSYKLSEAERWARHGAMWTYKGETHPIGVMRTTNGKQQQWGRKGWHTLYARTRVGKAANGFF